MDKFHSYLNRILTPLVAIGSISMVGMMLIVVTNIITRPFGKAIIGTYEAVELGIVVMVAFALGYTAVNRGHVFVNIITMRLSESVQRILFIITTFLGLCIWALIAWFTTVYAEKQLLFREGTAIMEWPVYPFRFILVLGIIIMCVVLIADIVRAIRGGAIK